MRSYGNVPTNFWELPEIRQLSDQAKLMAAYLMTGPHSNMLGCFRLPDVYVSEDLQWDIQTVKKSFHELIEINFLSRDDQLSWLVIHDYLKTNKIQSSKQGVCIQKLYAAVPEQSTIIYALVMAILTYGRYLQADFVRHLSSHVNGKDTLSQVGAAEQEQEQEQDQDQNQYQEQENETALGFASAISKKPLSHFINNRKLKKQSEYYHQAVEILEFLNEKANKAFEPTPENINPIINRLMTGETPDVCRQIIVRKSDQWNGVEKMIPNLNPDTLFTDKFSRYKGELVMPKEGGCQ